MHLDLFQGIYLLIELVLHLIHCPESTFSKQSDLVKCLLLPTSLNERPNLLWFLRYFILWYFLSLWIVRPKLNDLDC